jgi:hypothetical protein
MVLMKFLITTLALVTSLCLASGGVGTAEVRALSVERVAADAQLTHWLTASSGIRHNKNCRYYKNSKGRACSSTEGKACKKCGG